MPFGKHYFLSVDVLGQKLLYEIIHFRSFVVNGNLILL